MIAPVALVAVLGCAAPAVEAFHTVDVAVVEGSTEVHERFSALYAEASQELQVALPAAVDPLVYEGLVEAWARGVDVEVVTDEDRRSDPGFAALEIAGIPVVYADHAVEYFDFSMEVDVAWTSDMVVMSHAFAIADRTHAVAANAAGNITEGAHVVVDARGEDLLEDLWLEFNQVAGGTDAAELDEYSGMAKSVADPRWVYPTGTEEVIELWFGPQERLLKRVVDAVYGSRSSVYVLTDDLCDEGLARALQTKGQHGFDVRVVVGPSFGSRSEALSNILRDETPSVEKRRVPAGAVPTVVLVDTELGRDGRYHRPRALVLSHDLVSAARMHDDVAVVTDQYIDGAMWVVAAFEAPAGDLKVLMDAFEAHRQAGEAL